MAFGDPEFRRSSLQHVLQCESGFHLFWRHQKSKYMYLSVHVIHVPDTFHSSLESLCVFTQFETRTHTLPQVKRGKVLMVQTDGTVTKWCRLPLEEMESTHPLDGNLQRAYTNSGCSNLTNYAHAAFLPDRILTNLNQHHVTRSAAECTHNRPILYTFSNSSRRSWVEYGGGGSLRPYCTSKAKIKRQSTYLAKHKVGTLQRVSTVQASFSVPAGHSSGFSPRRRRNFRPRRLDKTRV